MSLFREQAVSEAQSGLRGEVLVLPRFRHQLLTGLLVGWLALVITFLSFADYARRETVRGWLHPEGGVVRVYPQQQGRLRQLLVGEGDWVAPGDSLAEIAGERVLADGSPLEGLLLREYEQQESAIARQLRRAEAVREQRGEQLRERARATGEALQWMGERVQVLRKRMELDQSRLQRLRTLAAAGHLSQAELENLEAQSLASRQEYLAMAAEEERQKILLQNLRDEIERLPMEAANETDQLRLKLSGVVQQMAQLRGNRAHIVKAPVAGRVSAINLNPGERGQPDRPLLSLLPQGSELIATLLVPVRSAGFVRPGQALQLRYDAFPYQKYGTYDGRIVKVSESALLPGDSYAIPFRLDEPMYRVTAHLSRADITAHGQRFALKPGMTLTADVQLEKRSLLQWLLEPVLSLRGRL